MAPSAERIQLQQVAPPLQKSHQERPELLAHSSSRSDLKPIPEDYVAPSLTDEIANHLLLENVKLKRRMDEIELKLTQRMDELRPEVVSKISQRVNEIEGGMSVVIKDLLNLRQQIETQLKESVRRGDKDIVELADAVQGLMAEFQICKASLERKDVATFQRSDSPDKKNRAIREQAGLAMTAPVQLYGGCLSLQELEQVHTRPLVKSSSRNFSPPRTASKSVASAIEVGESEVAPLQTAKITKPCGPIVRKQDGVQVSPQVTAFRVLRQARTSC